jgi:hypothetical protein
MAADEFAASTAQLDAGQMDADGEGLDDDHRQDDVGAPTGPRRGRDCSAEQSEVDEESRHGDSG